MKRGLGRGLTIVIMIFVVLLIAGGYLFFFQRDFVNNILSPTGAYFQVEIKQNDSSPVPNLEVRLWKQNDIQNKPPFKIATTNSQGVASFQVPAGKYNLGFKQEGFPSNLIYVNPFLVEIKRQTGFGDTSEKPFKIGIILLTK